MKKATFVLLLAAIVLSIAFVGCGKKEEVVEEVAVSSFPGLSAVDRSGDFEIGKKGGRFVVGSFGSDPKSFNYGIAKETSSTDVLSQMYSAAFERSQFDFTWQPDLAESWTMSDAQQVWTVTLKSDPPESGQRQPISERSSS